MRNHMVARVQIGLGLILIVLGCVGLLAGYSTRQSLESADWANHLARLDAALATITECVPDTRTVGYDGPPGKNDHAKAVQELRLLTADSLEQQRRIDRLQQMIDDGTRRSVCSSPAEDVLCLAASVSGGERRQFAEWQADAVRTAGLRLGAIDAGNGVALLLCFVCLGLVRSDYGAKQGNVPDRVREPHPSEGESRAAASDLYQAEADFAERDGLRAQLQQAQMSAAAGEMARGVAHDLNNMLGIVLNCGEVLQNQVSADAAHALMEDMRGAGKRAAALTRQFLSVGRCVPAPPTALNLNQAVMEFRGLLRYLLPSGVELVTALSSEVGTVAAARGCLEQILLNLVVNARDALPDGGRICIETRRYSPERGLDASASPRRFVVVAVTDTGVGISLDAQARLFEPYFTTKGPGKGMGLGLATVDRLVREAGGWVEVESGPGKGTSFRVYLPESEDAAPERRDAEPEIRSARANGETLLVVDDERVIRMLLLHVLRREGYRVLTAESAEEAIQLAARHEGPIQLLITDMELPGMSGPDLALSLTPAVKVLFMSGSWPDGHPSLPPSAAFLRKPATINALLSAVRRLLKSDLE